MMSMIEMIVYLHNRGEIMYRRMKITYNKTHNQYDIWVRTRKLWVNVSVTNNSVVAFAIMLRGVRRATRARLLVQAKVGKIDSHPMLYEEYKIYPTESELFLINLINRDPAAIDLLLMTMRQ